MRFSREEEAKIQQACDVLGRMSVFDRAECLRKSLGNYYASGLNKGLLYGVPLGIVIGTAVAMVLQ